MHTTEAATQVFYEKSYSQKIHTIHRKTLVLESLFNFIKKDSNIALIFCKYWKYFRTYFKEHLPTAASDTN